MVSLTYVKGLPTPLEELNAIGMSSFEMFLNDYSAIVHKASCLTVNRLLEDNTSFNKSDWNTLLQKTYGINKRHANGIIASSLGRIKGAKEHRKLHFQVIQRQIKSVKKWIKAVEKKLTSCTRFYLKKNWTSSTSSCLLPLSCSLKYKRTNKENLKFQVHHKKRELFNLENKLDSLSSTPIRVKIPRFDVFIVGSTRETLGNQVAAWNGEYLRFRIPYCLEHKYGSYLTTKVGSFKRNINRIPTEGAKTWHFYLKDGLWKVALQFTPVKIERYSNAISYGCIGIDVNPGSIDWAYVAGDGNLAKNGSFVLEQGLPRGKMKAQLVGIGMKLAGLASAYKCPVVCEELDFSVKKAGLKEVSRKLARMLSSWAYAEFFKQLNSILANRGIELRLINPAFTSLIGLVKYVRQYGISSGVAAAISIARRGMRLSEKIPCSIKAKLSVKEGMHSWSYWNKLNKKIKSCTRIRNRHSYYGISNWDFLAKGQ